MSEPEEVETVETEEAPAKKTKSKKDQGTPVLCPPIKDNKDYLFVNQGIMMLSGPINDDQVAGPIEQILVANSAGVLDHVTLMINSEGGSVASAFALIDIIRGSKIPVHTCGYGKICSSGLLIFMSGYPGERKLLPNTVILSHQFSSGSGSPLKEHDLMSNHGELVKLGKRMRSHYKLCSGLDLETIDAELLCPSDRWLSPKEAVKYNLADKIITKIYRK